MKRDEDIFNIFRKDQGKLDEMPSPRAWNRLEKKLNARHKKQRKVFYFQALAAASLALLLAMVTALSFFENQTDNHTMVEGLPQPDESTWTVMADSDVAVRDFNDPIIMTHTEQKRFEEEDLNYHRLKNNHITEENLDPGKKLEYKNNNIDPENDKAFDGFIAENYESVDNVANLDKRTGPVSPASSLSKGEPVEEELGLSIDQAPKDNRGLAEGGAIADKSIKTTTGDHVDFRFDEIEPVEKPVVTEADMETIDRKDLPEMKVKDQEGWAETNPATYLSQSEKLEKERTAAIMDSRKEEMIVDAGRKATTSKKKKPTKARLKSPAIADQAGFNKNEERQELPADDVALEEISTAPAPASNTIDINATYNAIEYSALDNNTNLQDIRLFEWLIGEWIDDTGESAETWTKKDDLTIIGKGSFMINGNAVFTEKMKITKIDDSLYFIVAVDSSNSENYYRLTRYDGQEAVFENADLAFPNQVIIKRNSNDDFSTIMQNNAPAQIQDTQQGYLLNRNQITNERAFRNLKRAND
ncbi:MAG: DUF6265 family protein [Bacteroidota bacterium]